MKFIYAALLAFAMVPATSHAAGKNAWTQCGIGALIFPSYGILAAVSNVIWDLGTTATTSSSSSPSQCAGKGASLGTMIYQNIANVEEETAVGRGEHLTAMLNVLGCDNNVHGDMISAVRSDFLKEVESPAYSTKSKLDKTEALFNNVMDKATGQFASSCAAAS
jgi:hypothetical protein